MKCWKTGFNDGTRAAVLLCACLAGASALGQQAPAAGAKPARGGDALDTAHLPDSDRAAESSPVAAPGRGSSLRVGTVVHVLLTQSVSSGSAHNGDAVEARLAEPLRTTTGATLSVGTPVGATVVSAAGAGVIASGGVLSLQLTRVGAIPIISDVRDFNGEEGHKDVADSAPQRGAEATVVSGAALEFRVMEQGPATGLVPGVPPAAGAGAGQAGAAHAGQGSAAVPPRAGSPNVPSTPSVPPPPRR